MAATVEILTIGDELLRGDLVDSNSAWIAQKLDQLGLPVGRIASIGDELAAIVGYVATAIGRCDALIISGGLGPTEDDRTAAAIGEVSGCALERDEEVLERLRRGFVAAGLPFTANNERQAWRPAGSTLLPNDRGTAPGFWLRVGDCRVFCLPGVPRELYRMFERAVIPALRAELAVRPGVLRRLKIFGLAEAQVDHRLADLLTTVALHGARVTLHYRATFPEIHVGVLVRDDDAALAGQVADALEQEIRRRLGHHVFAAAEQGFAEAMVAALRDSGATLALAESCTGGLAGDLITRASGASEVFRLSAVVYHNDAKQQLLGVPAEVLERDGAVSQACVETMARAVRRLAGTTHGVAISGIAGPTGGTPDKPVGTVHFALDGPRGTRHLHRVFPYGRDRIKLLSAYIAHWMVYRDLSRGAQETADPFGGRWQPKGAAREQTEGK